jgi:hypothetical protein
MKPYTLVLLGLALWTGCETVEPRTWVVRDGIVCGARPDGQGPIGGGRGYQHIVTTGDYVVETIDELLAALNEAQSGEVVFLPGKATLDLTGRIYIEQTVLEVPAGVTLASDRGRNGSKGALLCSDALRTPILIHAMGPGVRITGLRLRGPNPKRHMDHHRRSFGKNGKGKDYYRKLSVQKGIYTKHDRLEVDNCQISGFGHTGVFLRAGEGHRIHHNYIHHCQYHGLGYGVTHDQAASQIEYNLFDWNRHSIAGTGRPGCAYVARHNVDRGHAISHSFDMHGGRDRKDGTDIAGTRFRIVNNTFYLTGRAIGIRGTPLKRSVIERNWFARRTDPDKAILSEANVVIQKNVFGPEAKPQPEAAEASENPDEHVAAPSRPCVSRSSCPPSGPAAQGPEGPATARHDTGATKKNGFHTGSGE